MKLLALGLERVRRRFHPLHHLRAFPPVRWARARIDRPWLIRIHGVPHSVAVRLGRNLGTVLSLGRAEERELIDVLVCMARTNNSQVFWDVGANYGLFTFSLRAGLPGLEIEAFEPDPDYVALLHQTLGLGGSEHVRVHPVALSDSSGRMTFKRDLISGSTGFLVGSVRQSSAGAPDIASESGLIEVVASTIDVESDRLGVPDLIKIDVEGAELNVLEGGRRTLEAHMPIILLECTQRQEAVRRLLEDLGYEIRAPETPANRITGPGMPFMALALDPARHRTCEGLDAGPETRTLKHHPRDFDAHQ
jgi:FkbM family methyltransferase